MAACSRPAANSRIAVLNFENLTGDPANDWIATAAPTVAAGELGFTALRAGSASDGYLAQAGRFLHGYVTRRDGALRFDIAEEDATRHKMTKTAAYSGSVLSAMTAAAKAIDPAAREFSTAREDALEAWGRREFERAVAIDPDFGTAWLAWVETLIQQRDPERAKDMAERALARKGLRSELDRARIELVAANLKRDDAGRVKALREIARMTKDPAVMAALGESEVNARRFREGAAAFQAALAAEPENSAVMLSLGYAQAYAGDVNGAKETLEKYGKLPGQQVNSLDSLGEAFFMNGRFAEAEKYFLAAHQANPGFLQGTDLLKAAYARWLGGDLKGADEIAAKYFALVRNDVWQQASWLYATGRSEQAAAKLASLPDRRIAEAQLAVWKAPLKGDIAALKQQYEHTPPAEDGAARTFYAAALAASGEKDEAKKLVERWPLPAQRGPDQLGESRVFPTFLEVRKAVAAAN